MHKMVNGVRVELTKEEIKIREQEEAKATVKIGKYATSRMKAYSPIGDQLDAIWKQMAYMRLNGVDLCKAADEELGKYLAVKREFPKPEDK